MSLACPIVARAGELTYRATIGRRQRPRSSIVSRSGRKGPATFTDPLPRKFLSH